MLGYLLPSAIYHVVGVPMTFPSSTRVPVTLVTLTYSCHLYSLGLMVPGHSLLSILYGWWVYTHDQGYSKVTGVKVLRLVALLLSGVLVVMVVVRKVSVLV